MKPKTEISSRRIAELAIELSKRHPKKTWCEMLLENNKKPVLPR